MKQPLLVKKLYPDSTAILWFVSSYENGICSNQVSVIVLFLKSPQE